MLNSVTKKFEGFNHRPLHTACFKIPWSNIEDKIYNIVGVSFYGLFTLSCAVVTQKYYIRPVAFCFPTDPGMR